MKEQSVARRTFLRMAGRGLITIVTGGTILSLLESCGNDTDLGLNPKENGFSLEPTGATYEGRRVFRTVSPATNIHRTLWPPPPPDCHVEKEFPVNFIPPGESITMLEALVGAGHTLELVEYPGLGWYVIRIDNGCHPSGKYGWVFNGLGASGPIPIDGSVSNIPLSFGNYVQYEYNQPVPQRNIPADATY
ncbi:MAG: hypothetical protein AAB515_00530 [Patescibacteria group bacterium]